MNSLLYIEWMKLKNYRTFWVLSILYLVSITGINYIVFRIQQHILQEQQAKAVAQMVMGSIPYSFPTAWQMTSFVSSFLLFIPGLLIIISTTNEYSFKTHRQNIIDGWSRRQFISVKIACCIIIALISAIMVAITSVIFGFAEGSNDFSTEKMQYILYYFLQALSYSMAALLIAVLVKRGGLAIGIYFLYAVVLENVLKLVLNNYFDPVGRYLPLQSSDELIPMPLFEAVQKQFMAPPNYTAQLIMTAVYITAFFLLTRRKFETADL